MDLNQLNGWEKSWTSPRERLKRTGEKDVEGFNYVLTRFSLVDLKFFETRQAAWKVSLNGMEI